MKVIKKKMRKENKIKNLKIILASSSPRRKEIFKMLSLPFEVKLPRAKESFYKDPVKTAMKNSLLKVKDVLKRYNFEDQNVLIISADTIVVLEDKILGKPKNKKDAFNMLKSLSGKTHKVITSVGIYYFKNFYTFYDKALVRFKNLTDEEINWYISTKEPLDKAGSYGIQGIGAIFIREIQGDFFTVMGFPVSKFYDFLKDIDLDLKFLIDCKK